MGDFMDDVGDANPWGDRGYISEGDGLIEIRKIYQTKSSKGKKLFKVGGVCIEHTGLDGNPGPHKLGDPIENAWKYGGDPDAWETKADLGRINAFITAALVPMFLTSVNLADETSKKAFKAAGGKVISEAQPLRGLVMSYRARKPKADGKFVGVVFEAVAGQTPETIKARRAAADAGTKPAPFPRATVAAPVAPAPTPPPAPITPPAPPTPPSALDALGL